MPYTPHVWVNGETITSTKLNAIENGIVSAGTPAAGSIATSMLASNAATKANVVTIAPTSDILANSASYVDLTGLSMSVTTAGGDLVITLTGGPAQSNASGLMTYAINVNGTDYPVAVIWLNGAFYSFCGQVLVTGLAAGTYTVKARYKGNAGGNTRAIAATTPTQGYAQLMCVELKR